MKHRDIISDQFFLIIEKLIEEGYSEVDILKSLAEVLLEFVDGFEEVDVEDE